MGSITVIIIIQWNPSKTDATPGTKDFVLNSEVSLTQELVGDHAPLVIMAHYDRMYENLDDETDCMTRF